MKYLLQLILVVFVCEGCNSQSGPAKKAVPAVNVNQVIATKTDTSALAVSRDSILNDYCLFLAGMQPVNPNNIPAKLLSSPGYKKFASEMDANFLKIDQNRLSKMRSWSKTELKTEQDKPLTLFYPFSGPDILHALAFYPNATQYVMIAMERVGDIPNVQKMDSAGADRYLGEIYQSLQDIFEKSYFITHKMMDDQQKVKLNGIVTPLLCVFLERTGHSVVSIHKNHLNDDGTVSALAADSAPTHINDFIEIAFRTPGSDTLRKITYFRANLGDQAFENLPSLKVNKALTNYLNKLPDFYMYAKSASYLMNYGTFSAIRNICLAKSKSILQDDTGIGFKYFDKNQWKLKLYGHYVTPVRDFKGVYDAGLAAAYAQDSTAVKQLDFSLGYHWGNINNQNLMKAERK